jgi:hypothetical protein
MGATRGFGITRATRVAIDPRLSHEFPVVQQASPNVNHGTLDLFAAHRASNVQRPSVRVRCGTARAQIKMKFGTQVILALLFAGASAFVPASAPLRATSARAASKGQMEMAVPVGINGFGRIGRLVARIMCKSPETDLKLINSGASCEYMAYQMKYDSIHGRYDGTIEADGDVRPRAPPFPVSSSPAACCDPSFVRAAVVRGRGGGYIGRVT